MAGSHEEQVTTLTIQGGQRTAVSQHLHCRIHRIQFMLHLFEALAYSKAIIAPENADLDCQYATALLYTRHYGSVFFE